MTEIMSENACYTPVNTSRRIAEPQPVFGLVAQMQRNQRRRDAAKYGKGPAKRVAAMAVDQRWNLDPENKDKPRREIKPL